MKKKLVPQTGPLKMLGSPSFVAVDFFCPESHVTGWPTAARALMSMPKATVDKKHFAALRKYQIGTAWQITAVKPVSISNRMNESPNDQFGFRIFAAHSGH